MTKENGLPGAKTGEHREVVEALTAAIHSEPVQKFLIALRDIEPAERLGVRDFQAGGQRLARHRLCQPGASRQARIPPGHPVATFGELT